MLDAERANPALLGRLFIRNVLTNMRHIDDATVCFGLLGEWQAPNYQVQFPNGQILTFRGQNHERFGKEEFDPEHLSRHYTLSDIKNVFSQISQPVH